MHHKMHTSKQAAHHTDNSVNEVPKASPNIGPLPLIKSKHGLPTDADEGIASHGSKKRRKLNSNKGLGRHDLPSSELPDTTTTENTACTEIAPNTFSHHLPLEVQHLSSKYDFTTMSILSSAKICEKVEKLLLRVEKFSFADPKSKPGVVVLHAKSEVASKMVSIVQIARQDIERHNGNWWQYSKLDAQVAELKAKAVKRKDKGKTLEDWQKERAEGENQGCEKVGGETGCASSEAQQGRGVVNGDEEIEDAFESMLNPKEADQGAEQSRKGNGGKLRATPVMTIYFARVPVPGLKELYGEQTNS